MGNPMGNCSKTGPGRGEDFDSRWASCIPPILFELPKTDSDSGGIRGIVELQVLAEIQQHLGQLPIANFFDLIVGTR